MAGAYPAFWGLKDETNGGFYGQVNADLRIDEQAAKGGIACSRILWSFSAAYRTTGHETYLEYARHAFNFSRGTSLIANMADCIGWWIARESRLIPGNISTIKRSAYMH